MTDCNYGNSSGIGTTNSFDSKPPRQSRLTEIFSPEDEPMAERVRISPFTKNHNSNEGAEKALALSVTKSEAPSAASTTYTGYEKSMQPGIQKSSSSEQLKVSVLQHA